MVRSRTLIPNETGSDSARSAGVVGSVVPLTILAAVVFFFVRRRRQQQAQPQALNQDEQRPLSAYDPYKVPVSPAPYVSLLCDAETGKQC